MAKAKYKPLNAMQIMHMSLNRTHEEILEQKRELKRKKPCLRKPYLVVESEGRVRKGEITSFEQLYVEIGALEAKALCTPEYQLNIVYQKTALRRYEDLFKMVGNSLDERSARTYLQKRISTLRATLNLIESPKFKERARQRFIREFLYDS